MRGAIIVIIIRMFVFLGSLYFVHSDVLQYCASKNVNDERMTQFCVQKQIEGSKEFFHLAEQVGVAYGGRVNASSHGNDKERIVYFCMKQWEQSTYDTYDYPMINHCLKKQLKSYEFIVEPSNFETGTGKFCASEYPNDYSMMEFCFNKQIEAKKKLFAMAEINGIQSFGDSLNITNNGSAVEISLLSCMQKWEKPLFGTYDYPMIIHCLTK